MTPATYDLIVIGSGPAGQRAAMAAAKGGKRAVIIDKNPMLGGGCLHTGTLPSKSFRESVYRWSMSSQGVLASESDEAAQKAKAAKRALPDMQRLLKRKERVLEEEAEVIAGQLKRNGVDVLVGSAKLLSKTQVEVTQEGGAKLVITAPYTILAVGTHPTAPEFLRPDGITIFDSDTILDLPCIPKSMVVLGGGVIGCEYASIFAIAGTEVHLVDKRGEILGSVDREIVAQLSARFESLGMKIHLNSEAVGIERAEVCLPEKKGACTQVRISNGSEISAEAVLVALGRVGNTTSLGLENVGITVDARGLITVDKYFRTSVPNIYAAGDVIGSPALAATGLEQGRAAALHAMGLGEGTLPPLFPYGIYTIPEISMVGKTEAQAQAEGIDYVVGRAPYKELARGLIVGDQWGLLKIVAERKTLKILGVHIVGEAAANLVHIGQAVMDLGGDVGYFIRSVFNYPTMAEAYKTAAFNIVNQLKK